MPSVTEVSVATTDTVRCPEATVTEADPGEPTEYPVPESRVTVINPELFPMVGTAKPALAPLRLTVWLPSAPGLTTGLL